MLRRPVAGIAITGLQAALLAHRLGGTGVPARRSVGWGCASTAHTIVGLGRAVTMFAAPALLMALAMRRARSRHSPDAGVPGGRVRPPGPTDESAVLARCMRRGRRRLWAWRLAWVPHAADFEPTPPTRFRPSLSPCGASFNWKCCSRTPEIMGPLIRVEKAPGESWREYSRSGAGRDRPATELADSCRSPSPR